MTFTVFIDYKGRLGTKSMIQVSKHRQHMPFNLFWDVHFSIEVIDTMFLRFTHMPMLFKSSNQTPAGTAGYPTISNGSRYLCLGILIEFLVDMDKNNGVFTRYWILCYTPITVIKNGHLSKTNECGGKSYYVGTCEVPAI